MRVISSLPWTAEVDTHVAAGRSGPITEVADAVAASLRKPCFAEAVDKHLSVPSAAACHQLRNVKIGFELKQPGYRLRCFCFAPKMGQSCRKAEIGYHKSLVLADSFLARGNRLIETTKTDECGAHSCKR
jgi:hypothetical protein